MQIVQVLSSYRDDPRKHPEVEKELVSKLRSHWSNSAFCFLKTFLVLKSSVHENKPGTLLISVSSR